MAETDLGMSLLAALSMMVILQLMSLQQTFAAHFRITHFQGMLLFQR